MATIYDADVLIWAASQLTEARNKGLATSRKIHFRPYELLKAIHRTTSERDYERLEAAIRRLASTRVNTTIRSPEGEDEIQFHWLSEFRFRRTGKPPRLVEAYIVLSEWLYEGIVERGGVLRIAPEYFDMTGGLERWLYRVARKHGGHQPDGWSFTMAQLHLKSGTTRELKKFAADIREIVSANKLPEYRLELFHAENGAEAVRMMPRAESL
jgi:plasmid replication initiation protein